MHNIIDHAGTILLNKLSFYFQYPPGRIQPSNDGTSDRGVFIDPVACQQRGHAALVLSRRDEHETSGK